jgi:hypothetical protein
VNTNAKQHQDRHSKGTWHVADQVLKCDRYFGRVRLCTGVITPGERFFDTEERPDAEAKGQPTFKACHHCGLAIAEPYTVKKTFLPAGAPW